MTLRARWVTLRARWVSDAKRSYPCLTEKVDVFSFGVVLWEIWQLGEVPYGGRGMSEIWQGVMSGTLRPEVPADCDPAWAELMVSCWAAT